MAALLPLPSALKAQGLENGDFSHGHEHWEGDGQIVYLTADGKISKNKEDGAPIMEIPLKPGSFAELRQRFFSKEKLTAMNVEVVYKGSDHFLRNDNSPKYSNLSWKAGGVYGWSAEVWLHTDLCLKLRQPDGFCYGLTDVKPGQDWQTYHVRWEDLKGVKEHILWLVVPPGQGSLYVRSVAVK